MSSGYLEMIIGPMFSGKTSRILEIYRKAKYCNANVIVINHSFDNRYSSKNEVVNHNNEKIPCENFTLLTDFIETLNKPENDYEFIVDSLHARHLGQKICVVEQFGPALRA